MHWSRADLERCRRRLLCCDFVFLCMLTGPDTRVDGCCPARSDVRTCSVLDSVPGGDVIHATSRHDGSPRLVPLDSTSDGRKKTNDSSKIKDLLLLQSTSVMTSEAMAATYYYSSISTHVCAHHPFVSFHDSGYDVACFYGYVYVSFYTIISVCAGGLCA